NKSDYKLATDDQKALLVKLQRLEEMLLSTDLDLQMQLQKLRLMRDIMHRLDTVIAEEDREQKLSANSTDQDKRLQNVPNLREKLSDLIRRQTEHVEVASRMMDGVPAPSAQDAEKTSAAKSSSAIEPNKSPSSAADLPTVQLFHKQQQTRDDTKALE